MEKLFEMYDPQYLQSGIALGLKPVMAPLWTNGKSVIFIEGEVQKMPGFEVQARVTDGETITEVGQARADSINRAFVGTATRLFRWDEVGIDLTQIGSGFTGGNWALVPWGTFLVATNGIDPVQLWPNAGVAAPLAGVTFSRAEILVRRSPFLIAANTSNGENWIEWCSDDDINLWTPDSTNQAGNIVARDLDSEITCGVPLGEAIAFYSKNSMVSLNYIGGDFVFGLSPALHGIGTGSKRAVIVAGRMNYGVSKQGIWRTDGVQFDYLDDPLIGRWLRENINWDAENSIRGYYNARRNLIWWFLPTGSSTHPTVGIGLNIKSGGFTYTDVIIAAAAPADVFADPLLCQDNFLAFSENGFDAGTNTVDSFIQTKPMDCGEPKINKRIQQIDLAVKNTGGLKLAVGFQTKLDDPIDWLELGEAQAVNDMPDREGAYISLKLYDDVGVDGLNWSLAGFRLLGELTGFVA